MYMVMNKVLFMFFIYIIIIIMTEYNIDIYDPSIELYNHLFAHIILWMPLIIFLFILPAEQIRLKATYLKKYWVNYKQYSFIDGYGNIYDTGKPVSGSMVIESNGYQDEEGIKNYKWYIRMLKFMVFLSLLLPFYGYYVSKDFIISHMGMLLWFTVIFMMRNLMC